MLSTIDAAMELAHPQRAARSAGLRYVQNGEPGLARLRAGRGFRYVRPGGRVLRDPRQLERMRALAIPPAWERVWICADARGHLQATGRDVRGRKQYRYHERWIAARNEDKFAGMRAFAAALPGLRRQVRRDLDRPGLPRAKVLACVVRLLDQALIRVGNDEYARDNDSYGLTTMRRRQVSVNGGALAFRFAGKGGKRIDLTVHDPRAARIVRRCQELPGQELFQYLHEAGCATSAPPT